MQASPGADRVGEWTDVKPGGRCGWYQPLCVRLTSRKQDKGHDRPIGVVAFSSLVQLLTALAD